MTEKRSLFGIGNIISKKYNLNKNKNIDTSAITNDYQISGRDSGTQKSEAKKEGPTPNVLHKYASFNYVWTLSALSREELAEPSNVGVKIHDVIAKSSGIGEDGAFKDLNTNVNDLYKGNAQSATGLSTKQATEIKSAATNADAILRRGHDIFFEKVVINAVHRPNEARKMMNFTKIDIEMHEPFGVTLFEKLRAAAFNNKFRDHIDAPFLLTLQFRGYDNLGKSYPTLVTVRHLPIKITNAEMEINAGGTKYSLIAMPWTEFAMVDRYLYTRGAASILGKGKISNFVNKAIEQTGIGATAVTNNLSSALSEMAKAINAQQEIEISRKLRQFEDKYIIEADPAIGYQLAGSDNYAIREKTAKFVVNIRPQVAISKLITDLVQQADEYRDIAKKVLKYWKGMEGYQTASDGGSDKQPPNPLVPWFKIKTTVIIGEQFDEITKQHQKTILFTVIPYDIHVMNFTIPGLSASGLWGKYVKKVYKYIYTGENTDILDLKINYKYGHFQSRLYDGTRTDGGGSSQRKDLSMQQLVERYAGSSGQTEPLLPLRSSPMIKKEEDVGTGDGASRTKVDDFYTYLVNPRADMVGVQMSILGDPAFIGQDFALPLKPSQSSVTASKTDSAEVAGYKNFQWDEKLGCFNFDRAEPFITLDFRFPTDISETKSVMDFRSLENIHFSGLYKVQSVESIFDGGKFTQNLELIRYNNQGDKMSAIYTEPVQEVPETYISKDTAA